MINPSKGVSRKRIESIYELLKRTDSKAQKYIDEYYLKMLCNAKNITEIKFYEAEAFDAYIRLRKKDDPRIEQIPYEIIKIFNRKAKQEFNK